MFANSGSTKLNQHQRFGLAILTLLLLAVPWQIRAATSGPQTIIECLNSFEGIGRAKLVEFEKRGLADFSASSISEAPVRALASHVYVLELKDGRQFTVRMPDAIGDTAREQFAVQFLNKVPTLHTPATKLLSVEESKRVTDRLRQDLPDEVMEVVEGWKFQGQGRAEDNARVTIGAFYPITEGRKRLDDLGVSGMIRDTLEALGAREVPLNQKSYYQGLIAKEWPTMSDEARKFLEKDVHHLYPESRPRLGDELKTFLIQNVSKLHQTGVKRLSTIGLQRIPADLRGQLADYWATYSVLEIPDFHPRNWMIEGKKVVGVDLAHPLTDMPFEESQLHPFGRFEFSKSTRDLLNRSISPGVREYLGSLTAPQIQTIATESGYSLSDSELKGILKRIEDVKTAPKSARNP